MNTPLKRRAIGGGAYVVVSPPESSGEFWARPTINGRRTWRKLQAVSKTAAIREAAVTTFAEKTILFRDLAADYLQAGCPNRRLEPRPVQACKTHSANLVHLVAYFGALKPVEIRIPSLRGYRDWRLKRIVRKTFSGDRTVDLDLVTLSNVLAYAVATEQIPENPVQHGRPRYRRPRDVRHSRDMAPASANEIHAIARFLFSNSRSETMGWQVLWQSMTGCRTSELLRLRIDAKTPDDPGHISGGYLFLGRRSKGGVNPYALLWPELQSMLPHFLAWHADRHPGNPWFFPGRIKGASLYSQALGHALPRATLSLNLPRRCPHGFRSYYVTKRRGDGATDAQIAAEIGDKTVDLIRSTYGDRPAQWVGGTPLTWLPTSGMPPAWEHFQSPTKSPSNEPFHINRYDSGDSDNRISVTPAASELDFTI
jgi:integrase